MVRAISCGIGASEYSGTTILKVMICSKGLKNGYGMIQFCYRNTHSCVYPNTYALTNKIEGDTPSISRHVE